MIEKLIHRGPDADGLFADGPVVLGHRRLSVLDVSTAANQPMIDSSGRYVIVHNGEIYNFQDLRRQLEKDVGASFRTKSDTEVILEAYKAWGTECLQHFNGMFAFAIWDSVERRLFLARDRLGKKPLVYQPTDDGGFVFASEIKALRQNPAVKGGLNPRALGQFLSLNYVLTSECIVEGVKKLPPGYYLEVAEGKASSPVKYWDLAPRFLDKSGPRDPAEAAEALAALIDDAVRLRLVSDVPLGAFLSGGIDSSAIAVAMCAARGADGVETFSAGFQEETFDERAEARYAAKALGSRHRDWEIGPDWSDRLLEICYHADEPFADTSIIPTFALAGRIREHVTVALSGDGSDELFAGYDTFVADKLRHYTSWIPPWASRGAAALVESFTPHRRAKVGWDYKLRQFLSGHALDAVEAHFHWRRIFTEKEKRDLLRPEILDDVLAADPAAEFSRIAEEVTGAHYVDCMSYLDIKTWLADDILVKVDRATMAHGLEVRAPFLDHRLVEFAASLPADLKLRGLRKKYVLLLSQRGRLPDKILDRGKAGFNAPIAHWMSRPGTGMFRSLDPLMLAGDLFRPQAVRRLCEEHWAGRRDHSLKLFSLVMLHHWQKSFGFLTA